MSFASFLSSTFSISLGSSVTKVRGIVGGVTIALAASTLPACSAEAETVELETDGSSEQTRTDGGRTKDGGAPHEDADASDPKDAGSEDVTITEILGTLSGPCGGVRSLLDSPEPALITDRLVFVAGETYDKASLSPGGQEMFDTPNAGGSSTESEVISYEILHFCEGASLLKTETEVTYQPGTTGSITDILVEIDGKKVGVSVTRSYKPANQTYDDAQVKALLDKKLEGVLSSSGRVSAADKWTKQILHVFTANRAATEAIERVYPTISKEVRADTILLVTETKGGGFVYCKPTPPLGSECP